MIKAREITFSIHHLFTHLRIHFLVKHSTAWRKTRREPREKLRWKDGDRQRASGERAAWWHLKDDVLDPIKNRTGLLTMGMLFGVSVFFLSLSLWPRSYGVLPEFLSYPGYQMYRERHLNRSHVVCHAHWISWTEFIQSDSCPGCSLCKLSLTARWQSPSSAVAAQSVPGHSLFTCQTL